MVACSRCTFIFPDDSTTVCPVCNNPATPRGAAQATRPPEPWECAQCTFLNVTGPDKCEACDGPRPEPPPPPIDRQRLMADLRREMSFWTGSQALAQAIVDVVPPILQASQAITSMKKQLDSQVVLVREARYAVLLHQRSMILQIHRLCDRLTSAQLAVAAERYAATATRAMALASPAIDLASRTIADKNALQASSQAAASMLLSRSTSIGDDDASPAARVDKSVSECVDLARTWLDGCSKRRDQCEAVMQELAAVPDDDKADDDGMATEHKAQNESDTTTPDDTDMAITPRIDDARAVADRVSASTLAEREARATLAGAAAQLAAELTHMAGDVAERLHADCMALYDYCVAVTTRPRPSFTLAEAKAVQRASLSGRMVDLRAQLARMSCELELMRVHGVAPVAQAEATARLDKARQEAASVESMAAAAMADSAEVVDPWAALPDPVRRTGLVSLCSLEEYTLETSPLSPRVTRCLLHGHEPCVLKQFDLSDAAQFQALSADVAVRGALQETCIFVAPVSTVFLDPGTGFAYIESPIYEKGNAEDWLASRPEGHEVRHLVILILRALSALHARGMCHGNLHPRNILLVSFDFSPVLIDFSRARLYSSLQMSVDADGCTSDTIAVAQLLYKWVTGDDLIVGTKVVPPLPVDTPETVRELLGALVSGQCSASESLDLPFCSGDIVKEMIAWRQLVRLTSDGRVHQLQAFLASQPRRSQDFLIHVERDSILYGVITSLETAVSADLLMNFRTKYSQQSSQGIDQGGLTADLFTEFFLKIVAPGENLFECAPEEDCPTSGPSYLPNPQNFSLSFYAAIGKAMCKTLIDGRVVPLQFSSAMIKFFLDIDPDLSDLYDYDRTMANSFRNMMTASMSSSVTSMDVQTDMPLPCNRRAYVRDKIRQFLIERRRPQLEALRTGFFTLQGLRDQCARLAPADLRILICGVPSIDSAMVLREVVFEDAWQDSPTPDMLVAFLNTCSEEDLRRFLRLCTSLSCLPMGGLQRKITIRKMSGGDRLPVGHTCFHTLDMPDYADADLVRNKMQIVLSHIDHVGFGYA